MNCWRMRGLSLHPIWQKQVGSQWGAGMRCGNVEIEEELKRAHGLIFEKLPKWTKAVLALPEKERKKLIRDRKKLLKERAKKKASLS